MQASELYAYRRRKYPCSNPNNPNRDTDESLNEVSDEVQGDVIDIPESAPPVDATAQVTVLA